MGDFSSMNGMKRMMGLKGPTRKSQEKRAQRKRLTPLKDEEIDDIESRLGAPEQDEKAKKRRRLFDRVSESFLGGSSNGLGG